MQWCRLHRNRGATPLSTGRRRARYSSAFELSSAALPVLMRLVGDEHHTDSRRRVPIVSSPSFIPAPQLPGDPEAGSAHCPPIFHQVGHWTAGAEKLP